MNKNKNELGISQAEVQQQEEKTITLDHLKLLLNIASASSLMPEGSKFYLIESLEVSDSSIGKIEHTIKLYAIPSRSVFNPAEVDPVRIIKTARTYTDLDWMNTDQEAKAAEVVDLNVKTAIMDIVNGYFIKVSAENALKTK